MLANEEPPSPVVMEGGRQRGLASALPSVMHYSGGGHVHDAPPQLADAELEVDLLRIQEIIQVKSADGAEYGSSGKQTRAGHPIHLGRLTGLLGRRNLPSIG